MPEEVRVVVDLKSLPDAYERAYNKGVANSVERLRLLYDLSSNESDKKTLRYAAESLCKMIKLTIDAAEWK